MTDRRSTEILVSNIGLYQAPVDSQPSHQSPLMKQKKYPESPSARVNRCIAATFATKSIKKNLPDLLLLGIQMLLTGETDFHRSICNWRSVVVKKTTKSVEMRCWAVFTDL